MNPEEHAFGCSTEERSIGHDEVEFAGGRNSLGRRRVHGAGRGSTGIRTSGDRRGCRNARGGNGTAFFTITPAREVPPNLLKRALSQIRAGDLRGAYQMCDGRDELLANVIKSGLKMAGHDRYVIQEAMESEGERGAAALWQRISYINNVGVIAPLLGLLGTVWGMMRAFGAIAFDDAQSRALSMAYSVSMAMITTAAGLLLAIPALLAYYYFRGRVIKIIAEVEAQASEVVEALSRGEGV
jgi:biopolymer transport protein ExbB